MKQYKKILCCGNSMLPVLMTGDILLVNTTVVPNVGDIIVFNTPLEKQFVHRLIKKEGSLFITRGDNIRVIDSFRIGENDIIGVVQKKRDDRGEKKVLGGIPGLLTAHLRNIKRRNKQKITKPIIRLLQLRFLHPVLSAGGNILFEKRISLFRGEKSITKIYFKKVKLGVYCRVKREFFIRPVMQPFFSKQTLLSIQKRIESNIV